MDINLSSRNLSEKIIFLNPMGVDKSFWLNSIPKELYEKYDVVLFDYPGFNSQYIYQKTISETADYIFDKYIRGIDVPIHLCGYSYGGMVAQELLKRDLKELKSVILIATQNKLTTYDKELNKLLINLFNIDLLLFCRLLVLLSYNPSFVNENKMFYLQVFSSIKLSPEIAECITQQLDQMRQVDEIKFPVLDCSALYLYGEFDRMVKDNTANGINQLLPNIEVVKFSNSSHMIDSRLIFKEIIKFLNKM
ncbi:alpha/beta hydrolase fold protein [Bacteroides coprosuis DSM 18011]|uniref:Alpha/beta hydrolase fold protein n=1 Tax=Bacteroides coprosuis DSM 18011 TaxID=679937 RepID=F3ZNH1_9BACE|nr:alpha/beta hydrolase [Bacteroides coprosuis]EGJ72506.1 alpha/beta hydrolase fold protein [Bacteroides coprosuis DSM 18011]